VRHVAANTLRWRRRRATAEFIAVYLAVWVAFGGCVIAALRLDPALGRSDLVVGLALAVAAAWQLTPAKRRALRACHTSTPLPPRGWRASAGVGRFGLRNAGACVGSCWALMAVMTLARGPGLLWMALLSAIVSAEKLSRRPARVTRAVAVLLAAGAAVAIVSPALATGGGPASRPDAPPARAPAPATAGGRAARASPGQSALPLGRALGQMIITGFDGSTAPAILLARIRDGHVGGVILFADNTADSQAKTARLVASLRAAAAAGGQPGLLVMTDQEGGEVKRLPGPPDYAASAMTTTARAAAQGLATGRYLAGAGVDVDLAPVADVRRNTDGFLAVEQRTFGSTAAEVASRACAFARGLGEADVVPTLKHFPGLGRAVQSTDTGPVTIDASAGAIRADDLVYRDCGETSPTPTLVMVSSAIYPQLTGGHLPAVISPEIYQTELRVSDDVDSLTISDDLGAGALAGLHDPAVAAIDAGLDLLLYATDGSGVGKAYATLLADAKAGTLSESRIQAAAAGILALKRAIGLPNA
jgi:beta-N-acetylhexosaminidase